VLYTYKIHKVKSGLYVELLLPVIGLDELLGLRIA
jgi:hypothetical protein